MYQFQSDPLGTNTVSSLFPILNLMALSRLDKELGP